MNIPNLRLLAARLRAPATEGHFNLASWFSTNGNSWDGKGSQVIHDCGTTACIAGHAAVMASPTLTASQLRDYNTKGVAQHWLGLDYDVATELFNPTTFAVPDRPAVTRFEAAEVIDRLIETGGVSW